MMLNLKNAGSSTASWLLQSLLLLSTTVHTTIAAPNLSYNGLSSTPRMGWDTYNAYALSYNETTIQDNAQRLVDMGFRDLGYKVVIFDDAMTELNRSANGSLVENASKFPGGLKNLADQLHADGLQFGVYSSAGKYTCGKYPGSLGYETIDAAWWASLGADYLKYDNCYNEGQSGTPQISEHRYAVMSNALNNTGRDFVYSLCNWGDDKPWEWAPTISNSARISGDIYDAFARPTTSCPCGPDQVYCQSVPGYACSVFNILGKASYITSKVQQGYYNDLDMLEVGNGNMNYEEYKLHFSMWSAIKSPLIMGNKLYELSPEDYAILVNPAVIALNQDPDGTAIQRILVETPSDVQKDRWGNGEVQVWSGGLSGGDHVVAFLNIGNASRNMEYSLVDIFGGLSTSEEAMMAWDMFDVWGNQTVMPNDIAANILNGTMQITDQDAQKWYYNASAPNNSWAEGIARNDTLLMGTPVGSVAAGGSITAEVPKNGLKMWRLKQSATMRKRDEL